MTTTSVDIFNTTQTVRDTGIHLEVDEALLYCTGRPRIGLATVLGLKSDNVLDYIMKSTRPRHDSVCLYVSIQILRREGGF